MFNKRYFGERVKKFRLSRGLTHEELAEMLGITHNYVSRIEHGNHMPTVDTIISLLNILGINYSTLMDDSDEDNVLIDSIFTYASRLNNQEVKLITYILSNIKE